MSLLSSALGGIGKNLGGVASLAAPFIGGPVGAAVGLAGGLIGAGKQQQKASQIGSQQQGAANTALGIYNKNAPLVSSAYSQNAGIDPTTGQYNASYNPYQPLLDQYYSPQAINQRAAPLFDPSQLNSQFVAQQEQTDSGYNNAVSAANADIQNRGFTQGMNTLSPSAVSQIRLQQAGANTAGRRSLLSDLLAQKNNYIAAQQNQGQNVALQGFGAKQQNLNSLGNFTSGSASQGLGTLGGLQGLYANNANQGYQGVASSLGQVFSNSNPFGGSNPLSGAGSYSGADYANAAGL